MLPHAFTSGLGRAHSRQNSVWEICLRGRTQQRAKQLIRANKECKKGIDVSFHLQLILGHVYSNGMIAALAQSSILAWAGRRNAVTSQNYFSLHLPEASRGCPRGIRSSWALRKSPDRPRQAGGQAGRPPDVVNFMWASPVAHSAINKPPFTKL